MRFNKVSAVMNSNLHRKKATENTVKQYRTACKAFAAFIIDTEGTERVPEERYRDLAQKYFEKLKTEGKSPDTVHTYAAGITQGLRLSIDDFDIERRTRPKKGRKTLAVIRRAIALNPEGTYVFEYNGRPVNPTTYRKHVKKLCEAAGVPYHNPHSARSFAASVLNTGDNIQEMCDYFGWSCASMASLYGRNIADSDSVLRANLSKIAHSEGSTP